MGEPTSGRVKRIFGEALERPPGERESFLDSACGTDAALRSRVDRLLAAHDEVESFLGSPTLAPAAVGPSDSPTRTLPGGAALAAAPLRNGSILGGRYRIVGHAGSGGMGEVYRADDLTLDQPVALKLLPAELSGDDERLARLLEEVRTARRVAHPNVCRVYDVGEADGRHFLSMEWIGGTDLGSLLRKRGRLPEAEATLIAAQLCAGLAAAHDRGVVHRDLKPSNVMIDERGVARISDFGLAEVGSVVRGNKAREGTPGYMSPEQLAGDEVTYRSDLYALGLVFHELFTGRPAFPGDTVEELALARSEPPPAPSRHAPGIDPDVERLILRCLDPDPSGRPASAAALLEALPGGASVGDAMLAAQRRADRIAAFRAELAELRRTDVLRLDQAELRAVDEHHDSVMRDLVRRFDIDVSDRGKQYSLGLRAVSLIGAAAFAASVFYFFYRIWADISLPAQIAILLVAPVSTLLLTSAIARRERSGYFTLICGIVAFACLATDTSLIASTFDLVPSPVPVLAWGLFATTLAYGFRLRVLLAVGLVALATVLAGLVHHATGGYWALCLNRPESFLPAGLAMLAAARIRRGARRTDFAPVYRVLGLAGVVGPTLFLGSLGFLSYLPLNDRAIETAYQVLGFSASAAAIGFGIARHRRESVYAGSFFLVTLLFVEFFDWWWSWMPKYLFFLIVAVTSLAVVFALKRLRATLADAEAEVER